MSRNNEYTLIDVDSDATRQNLVYAFDPVGNVGETSGSYSGSYSAQSTENGTASFPSTGKYRYDNLYRLISASGYEGGSTGNDLSNYTRAYSYDDGNNLTFMQHFADGSTEASATTFLHTSTESNRAISNALFNTLTTEQQENLNDALIEAGMFDVHGNQLLTSESTAVSWNYSNEVLTVTQTSEDGSTLTEYYVYSGPGTRVRKISATADSDGKITQLELAAYLHNLEYRSTYTGTDLAYDGETVTENGSEVDPVASTCNVRIRNGHTQIAQVSTNLLEGTGSEPTVRYYLDNHIARQQTRSLG